MKSQKISKKLLITGCGRSGTKYSAFFLKKLKLDIGHEYMGKDGISSWCMAIDSQTVPWGPSAEHCEFKHIFHQVRHPLLVFSSLENFTNSSWQYIYKNIPCINNDDPPILQYAKYWYFWNIEAEKKATWRYQIENLDKVGEEFCAKLDIKYDRKIFDLLDRNINTRYYSFPFSFFKYFYDKVNIEPPSLIRSNIFRKKSAKIKIYTWNDLQNVDHKFAQKVQDKAIEYGYLIEKMN